MIETKDPTPQVNDSEIISWKDIVFPAIYIILLLVLVYFIWKLLSPFLALGLAGLVAYIHFLRDFFNKD